jgi:dihydrolipoamide dehydrogenase
MAEGQQTGIHVAVLGGGPGGYAAAFHAADHGMKVTLIDADPQPGGVCLHRGCIPSKALLHIAKLLQEAKEAEHWGVSFGPPKIDLAKIRQFKTGVVNKLTGGIAQLAKARGVTLIRAMGKLVDSKTLALTPVADHQGEPPPAKITFDKCIVATGSSPAVPPAFRLNDPRVMDSTGALELADLPKKLLVVGGGYIGLEMGSVYAALGSKVTVVELTETLLPGADRDLVRPLQKRLEGLFESILLKTKVAGLEASKDGIIARLEGEGGAKNETFDRVLVSIGRRPNSQNIGLETTKVKVTDKGFVQVDKRMATADPNIYAIGDIAGEPMLAHKATKEGKVAVEAIAGEPSEFDNIAIPAVVFTDPEIAWCGLTETQAQAEGRNINVLRFPWAASGRAQTLARTEGSTKLIVDPETERVLGVGIVGPGAGELIAEGVLAVETAAVAEDIANTIHAHPTLSETLMESAEMSAGQATHVYRPTKK